MVKRGPTSQGLGETNLYVRCTTAMKARVERAVARRAKVGRPTTVSKLLRDWIADALANDERYVQVGLRQNSRRGVR